MPLALCSRCVSSGAAHESAWRSLVSGRLPQNSSYRVEADCSLNTWDSYNQLTAVAGTGYWDVFLISLSTVKYWDQTLSDPITAPYKFGGDNGKFDAFKQSVSQWISAEK